MTLKNYLVVMLTLSAICWGIFFFIATLVDPLTTNWLGFLLFYASLFAALSGSIALLGFFVRFIVRKKDLAFNLALDILSKDKIDALVCNDNIVAYSVIKAAKKLGIKIPNELGLVTFDNFPLAEFTDPELTAICIDTYQQGEQAAKMLFESIKGNQTIRNTMVNPTIVIRESSRRNK